MSTKLTWYDDNKTIAIIDHLDEPTWTYWYKTLELILNAIEDAPGDVNLVLTGFKGIPAGNPLPHMKRTFDILNNNIDRIGMVVLVGQGNISFIMNTIFDALSKVSNRPINPTYFSTSLDDAVNIILQETAF